MDAHQFDLAGCCIGVVERTDLLDGTRVHAGDALLGLAASGLHANGFSLVRGLVAPVGGRPAGPVPGAPAADARHPGRRGGPGRRAGPGHGHRGRRAADARPASMRAPCCSCVRPCARRATTCTAWPTSPVAGCPATCHGSCPTTWRPRSTWGAGRCPRSCASWAPWAASTTPSCGRPSTAAWAWSSWCRRTASTVGLAALAGSGVEAWEVGTVVAVAAADGARYLETRPARLMARDAHRGRRLGHGLQPRRAPARPSGAGRSAATISLVFADRDCPALGIARGGRRADPPAATGRIRPARRRGTRRWRRRLRGAGRHVVALAGFMRVLGPAVLAAFRGRILNVHPSLLPAFPGAPRHRRRAGRGRDRHGRDRAPGRRDARRRPDRAAGGGHGPAR